jgi:hypothetical protein
MALPACCNCSPCLFTVPLPTLQQSMLLFSLCLKPSPLQAVCGGLHSCLLWQACLFTVPVGKCPSPILQQSVPHGEAPSPFLQSSGHPTIFAMCSLFQMLVYYYFFFLQGGSQSVQGAMLIFLRGGCGRTSCHLFAHLWVCQAS